MKLYTMDEVAGILGWKRNTLFQRTFYTKTKRVPEGSVVVGKRRLYTDDDLRAVKRAAVNFI